MRCLDDLLEPLSTSKFLGEYWGNSSTLLRGNASKFSSLFSWNSLNEILATQRLDHPRLRVELAGELQPTLSFLNTFRTRRGYDVPQVEYRKLFELLGRGATLVIDSVEQTSVPLMRLSNILLSNFITTPQINLYASWGDSPGFGLHWDDHDVFILQIEGRKYWKIYKDTRRFPSFRDVEPNTERPSEDQMCFQGEVQKGDLIYIPRGHWHDVVGLNEPSLHLTLGITAPTWSDFLQNASDEIRGVEFWRRDLPLISNEIGAVAFGHEVGNLSRTVRKMTLEDFWSSRRQKIRFSRVPSFPSLPSDPVSANTIVAATGPISLTASEDNHETILRAQNRELSLPLEIHPLLYRLTGPHEFQVSELFSEMPNNVEEPDITALIADLLHLDILWRVSG